MGPDAQYYQGQKRTGRNYTTITRFENATFKVMGDNLQHFLAAASSSINAFVCLSVCPSICPSRCEQVSSPITLKF